MTNMSDRPSVVIARLDYGCCVVVESQPLIKRDAE